MQFGHDIKVHTVQATDEGRWQEDDIDDREDLDDTVLLDVYQTEEGILEVVQTVKTETGVVKQRVDILDDHRQTRVEFFGEEIALEDVGDNALFIHDVLSDDGHFFLQVLDLYEQIFIDVIGLGVDLLREFGDHIGRILYQVGILLHSRLEQTRILFFKMKLTGSISKLFLRKFELATIESSVWI